MYSDRLQKFQKQLAEQKKQEDKENPLSQYSTTQLKKELRRRKNI